MPTPSPRKKRSGAERKPKAKRTGAYRPLRYPWEEWFAADSFVLRRSRDYRCLPHGIAQMVRDYAFANGYKVSVSIDGDEVSVTIKERP